VERSVVPRSHETCRITGIYRSGCIDGIEIARAKGTTFPPCGKHGVVTWTLVRATEQASEGRLVGTPLGTSGQATDDVVGGRAGESPRRGEGHLAGEDPGDVVCGCRL
jgi:hypothetical protein